LDIFFRSGGAMMFLPISTIAAPVAAFPTPAQDILSFSFESLLLGDGGISSCAGKETCGFCGFRGCLSCQFLLLHELLQNFCTPLLLGI